jgi:hypothetical protein
MYDFDVAKEMLSRKFRGLDISTLGLSAREYESQYPFPDNGRLLRDAGAAILDPAGILVIDGQCRVYDSGGSYYSDANHLSAHGAWALHPLLSSIFKTIRQADDAVP